MTPATLTPSVRTYVRERYKQGRINKDTAASTRSVLLGFAEHYGHRPMDKLGVRSVEQWLESIAHLAPGTRRHYLSTVRGYTCWLVRRRMIRYDPCLDIPPIKVPRPGDRALPAQQVTVLLAHTPDVRGEAIIHLMVGCGLRCVEITRLQVGDYNRHDQTLSVVGKASHPRTVPVPAEVRVSLERYLATVPANSGPLIRSYRRPNEPLGRHWISTLCSRWMRDAQLKSRPYDGVSGHALRHTAGSDVFDRCENLPLVADFLGHNSVDMARRYTRRTQVEKIRRAIEGRQYGELVDHNQQAAA
jgi:site-specific recombinase XerD